MAGSFVKTIVAGALMLTQAAVQAEDIDLFAKTNSSIKPNVLIILDNTANWQQQYPNLKSALVSLMANLPADKFNVGLMLFTESGTGNSSDKGAYVRAAVRLIDDTNKGKYGDLFNSLDAADKGDRASFGMAMAEAYRYFAGTEAIVGHGKVKRDYKDNVSGSTQSNAVYALAGNAFTDGAADSTYTSPIDQECQKNFIIFISNSAADGGENNGDAVKNLLAAAGGNTTEIVLSPSGSQGVFADEWARFLASTDLSTSLEGRQNVITYTIDVDPKSTGQGPGNTALLKSMADQGGGNYFSVSAANGGAQVATALNKIFSDIYAVDTAFASASLPVSVNAQGTYLNQVFIGMFRPADNAEPRWYGNMKQYQFQAKVNSNGDVIDLELVDSKNNPAINPVNGFISSCAVSYWSTADTYWPGGKGSCLDPAIGTVKSSNSPDGEIVEKGAAAQKLRALAVASRNVKTGSGTLDDFSASNTDITKALLGDASMTDAERTNLINWVRGQNVDEELSKSSGIMRPSVHGDVVHSRPLAIDYGGTTGVVTFYGSNDGTLRAIDGNKIDSAGNELWAYVAPEHYGRFLRLRKNDPVINFPGITVDGAKPKDYFFDGPIGVYKSGSTKWIYPTMRRGGSHVYAFDVSTPAVPTMKWKFALPDGAQSWSEPKIVKVKGYEDASGNKKPLIIMGGGYDTCEDGDKTAIVNCTSAKGNRVYVIDANDGTVKMTLGTGVSGGDAIQRSVPADITVVDSDDDGYVDMAYVVDTGANIYRIDIGAASPEDWKVRRLASLGCDSGMCGRKLLFAPEVVVTADFNAVLAGSGNRERPLLGDASNDVDNGFFMIKDDRSTSPTLITTSDLVAIDPEVGATDAQKLELASASNKGWYLAFGTGGCTEAVPTGCHDREQVVTAAVVVAGVVYFSTHIPTAPTGCETLGIARGYAVSFMDADGSPVYNNFKGGGLPPSPVTGVVNVALTGADGSAVTGADGSPVMASIPFIIGGGGLSGLDPTKITVNPSGVRGRVYWYIQQ